jgi:hypothetical protein
VPTFQLGKPITQGSFEVIPLQGYCPVPCLLFIIALRLQGRFAPGLQVNSHGSLSCQ